MKFPKIKIPLPGPAVNLSLLLTVILLLLFAVEGYLIFSSMYTNLAVNTEVIVPSNVVRVDLKAYEGTINFLDSLKNYEPDDLSLKRQNPFR